MKHLIRKNNHYPFPFFPVMFPKWVHRRKPTVMTKRCYFTESCLYDFKNEDQHDVNKLFGFSIGHHHTTSFRFGWRPLPESKSIEIVAYEYHDGIRQSSKVIGKVPINTWRTYTIVYNPKHHDCIYFIDKLYEYTSPILKKSWGLGYTLSLYFGGNRTSPHDMIIFFK